VNNVNIKYILSQDFSFHHIIFDCVCVCVEDRNPVRSVAQKERKKEQEREQKKEVSQEKQRRARGEGYSE
jgi:hypothetical protein